MKVLVADSGSTKTDWFLIENHIVKGVCSTLGLNPYHVDTDLFQKEINVVLNEFDVTNLQEVHFYGSGVSNEEKTSWVENELKKELPGDVFVYHDLFGAARAACGNEEGIAIILGTGSNSCYYKEGEIVDNVASLGYVFSDEGGGADIGKLFMEKFYRNTFNDALMLKLKAEVGDDLNEMLNRVYKTPKPNEYIASFAKVVFEFKNEPEIKELILTSFNKLFETQILKYRYLPSKELFCVGSIAEFFNQELNEVAEKHGYELKRVVKSPIKELIKYHQ